MNLCKLVLLQSRGYYDVMDEIHDYPSGNSSDGSGTVVSLILFGGLILLILVPGLLDTINDKRKDKSK